MLHGGVVMSNSRVKLRVLELKIDRKRTKMARDSLY